MRHEILHINLSLIRYPRGIEQNDPSTVTIITCRLYYTILSDVVEIAKTVAKRAPLGVQATIRSARTAAHEGVDAAVEELLVIARELMDTEDAAEGVRSFLERRKPRFRGA